MSYQKLWTDIKNGQLDKLYLFYGEEAYLMEASVNKIKGALISPQFEEFNFQLIEGKDLIVEKLIDVCETLPFMASHRLVLVRDFEGLQGKKRVISEEEEGILIDYLPKIPESTCLIFYGNETVDSRKRLVKALGKVGQSIQFEKLKEPELAKWIEDYVKQGGKKITAKEISYLMNHTDYVGRNSNQTLGDMANELDKVIAFVGEGEKIEIHHIEEISTFKLQNDIFKLLDAIGQRNVPEAMKRLDELLAEGEAVIRLMVTLGNQVKHILSVKSLMEEGYSSKLAAGKIGIHPFVASKCAAQGKYYSEKRLRRLLNLFLERDYEIKSGKINDRIALELLIMEMCASER